MGAQTGWGGDSSVPQFLISPFSVCFVFVFINVDSQHLWRPCLCSKREGQEQIKDLELAIQVWAWSHPHSHSLQEGRLGRCASSEHTAVMNEDKDLGIRNKGSVVWLLDSRSTSLHLGMQPQGNRDFQCPSLTF